MISVVIPLYNKAETISRCLKSVLSQSYKNFECVVVDDGSTDNGAEIVNSFKDSRIKYYFKKNGGVSSARNYGVKCALADSIVFLDADDFLIEDALEILCNRMSEIGVDCVAANFYRRKISPDTIYTQQKSGFVTQPFKLWYFNKFCPRTGCAIFKKSVLEENPFREDLCRYEDAESLFNIMRKHHFYFDERPVMIYTDDHNGLSVVCADPDKDFLFHMIFRKKSWWEKMCLLHFLNQAYDKYPSQNNKLRMIYGSRRIELVAERLFFSLFNKIWRFF